MLHIVGATFGGLMKLLTTRNLCIMTGGISEIFCVSRTVERLYFKKRFGFVKLAILSPVNYIVPVYIFGHTRMFDQIKIGESFLRRLSRMARAGITIFWGRWGLPVPYKRKITLVEGKPIPVPAPPADGGKPTHEEIQRVHALVEQEIVRLYHAHRETVNGGEYADTPLVIE
jgi:2-acylglycerol O-acyltransferase 2